MEKLMAPLMATLLGGLAMAICVLDGTSVDVKFDKPADYASDPVVSGPSMKESDDATGNESMGPGTTTADGGATGKVTNSGGDLFGVRGGKQNGVGEGDCIEVIMCWTFTHSFPGYYGFVYHPDGDFFTWGWIPGYEADVERCTAEQEVCPDGSC